MRSEGGAVRLWLSPPNDREEPQLSGSNAEKIVIDDAVCEAQQRGLAAQARTLDGTVGPAAASLGGTAFGVMNSFLVGPMNAMAGRTSELAAQAAAMAGRMSTGVGVARATFAELEADTAATFDGWEVEA